MTESVSKNPDAGGEGTKPEPVPELVPGRGRLRDYALQRLKASRWLQVSMVVAILCYGAIPFLLIYPDTSEVKLSFWLAISVLMSLASWSLLFWWYPVFERTQQALGADEKGRAIAGTLETLAIGCVVVVHALMAFIIIWAGVMS